MEGHPHYVLRTPKWARTMGPYMRQRTIVRRIIQHCTSFPSQRQAERSLAQRIVARFSSTYITLSPILTVDNLLIHSRLSYRHQRDHNKYFEEVRSNKLPQPQKETKKNKKQRPIFVATSTKREQHVHPPPPPLNILRRGRRRQMQQTVHIYK